MPSSSILRYGDNPDQHVAVWDPVGPIRGSAVLIHGGYWRDRYALDLMDPMAAHLAGQGWRVWNVEYRRIGPDDRGGVWADMAADIRAAIALVEPEGDGRPIIAIGHSAGGQLALWAAADSLALPLPPEADTTTARGRLDAVVALAPVADLVEADRLDLSDGAARLLLGGDHTAIPDRYRDASPMARVPLGLPQLVVHGDADDAVPLTLSATYVEAADAAGDDVAFLNPPGVDHFHVIDPAHDVWRPIEAQLDRWASTLAGPRSGDGPTNGVRRSGRSFDEISDDIGRFTAARNWDRYHNPKNLLLALVGEVGELTELFQWLSPHEAANPPAALRSDIEAEAADVLIYLMQFARKLDIDLLAAVETKMAANADRFPEPDTP